MSADGGSKTIELFIQCHNLVGSREKPYDAFAVVMMQPSSEAQFQEVQRTETLSHTKTPHFSTSIEVSYHSSPSFSPVLRFDLYERKTDHAERLRDHAHRGTVMATISDILGARGKQLSLLLHHPRDPRNIGTITVLAEQVDVMNNENSSIVQVDVTSSILRKRDWNKTMLGQRYQLCRAHRYDDEHNHPVWLPVYRSDRMMKIRGDSSSVLEFSTASITYRHLCNADEERVMRLEMYTMAQGTRKQEVLVGKAEFTLRFLCEIDPTEEVLGFEREDGVGDDIGNVSIVKAEPTDFGSHFSFHVKLDHAARYTSAENEEDKMGAAKGRKRLKFDKKKNGGAVNSATGGGEVTGLSGLSLVDGLFKSDHSEGSVSSDHEIEEVGKEDAQ